MKLACAVETASDRVTLAHGAGGRMMHRLVRSVFRAAFRDEALDAGHDGAVVPPIPERVAMTTDSFVVRPLFFPGGDIGSLAVHGTVNDLAMCGAQPLYLTCGFILEEGLPLKTLSRVAESMAEASRAAGVRIVTGDTKVVERGKVDGLFINTAGVGRVVATAPIAPSRIRPGDALLLSGPVGRHGAAILSARESLGFETALESDAACVWPQVRALLDAGVDVRCLRDLTRGGLATALNELAAASGAGVRLDESGVRVDGAVASACELYGLDPFYMACEGRFCAFVAPRDAARAIEALRGAGAEATLAGAAVDAHPGQVRLRTGLGVERVLDMLEGEALPRIC